MVTMGTVGRIAVSLFVALCGFTAAFLVGFYASMLFGANMHDSTPGVVGLLFGVFGAILTFTIVRKRLDPK
jgi:hypothetical protein